MWVAGCKGGPLLDVCISDPASAGFQCIAKDRKTTYYLPYDDSNNYVAFSPDDTRTLLEFCKLRKKRDGAE